MKMYRFKQLGISPLRAFILPALLISCIHGLKGEIIEYSVNHESKNEDYNNEKYENGEWEEIAFINLKKGESLELIKGSFVRQLNLVPSGWYRNRGIAGNWVKFVFTHEYLDEEVTIRWWGINPGSGKWVYFGDERAENIPDLTSANDLTNSNSNLMIGPCKIRVFHSSLKVPVMPNGQTDGKYEKLYTPKQTATIRLVKKTITSTNAQSTANKNVLVLPKGTGTNELILESSEDLITWEKDVPGDKNTDSGNRFYRLRAVKK